VPLGHGSRGMVGVGGGHKGGAAGRDRCLRSSSEVGAKERCSAAGAVLRSQGRSSLLDPGLVRLDPDLGRGLRSGP
jgi:hypothetical protein